MQGLSQDSLKQQIVKLEAEIEVYRTIFDLMPLKVWFKDTANRLMKLNKAAAELDGKKVKELEGKSAYQLYPKDIADAYYQHDLQVIQTGEPILGIVEPFVSPATGETSWLETGKVPYYGKGTNVSGVVAFAIDITEKQQVKQQLADQTTSIIKAVDELIHMVNSDADKRDILDRIESLRETVSAHDATLLQTL